MAVIPGTGGRKGRQHHGCAEKGRRRLHGPGVGPDDIVGGQPVDHGRGHGRKKRSGALPGKEKHEQHRAGKKHIVGDEEKRLVCAEEGEKEAEQKRPAGRLLVVLGPDRLVHAVLEQGVVGIGRLAGLCNGLAHVAVDVFVVVDPVGPGGDEHDQHHGGGDDPGQGEPLPAVQGRKGLDDVLAAYDDTRRHQQQVDPEHRGHEHLERFAQPLGRHIVHRPHHRPHDGCKSHIQHQRQNAPESGGKPESICCEFNTHEK